MIIDEIKIREITNRLECCDDHLGIIKRTVTSSLSLMGVKEGTKIKGAFKCKLSYNIFEMLLEIYKQEHCSPSLHIKHPRYVPDLEFGGVTFWWDDSRGDTNNDLLCYIEDGIVTVTHKFVWE